MIFWFQIKIPGHSTSRKVKIIDENRILENVTESNIFSDLASTQRLR